MGERRGGGGEEKGTMKVERGNYIAFPPATSHPSTCPIGLWLLALCQAAANQLSPQVESAWILNRLSISFSGKSPLTFRPGPGPYVSRLTAKPDIIVRGSIIFAYLLSEFVILF